ncbi:COP23 domain-containing protein [Halothece sp. PCC 7418]|uniref:COP23 domain-containing protein n=1 Tax=Halothece sp. (strain PCC 7418) TaxID=65093 RepID=UPI0002EABF4A|nr:COP23 domain-containing protein [Halothece sp. PCC 7418]
MKPQVLAIFTLATLTSATLPSYAQEIDERDATGSTSQTQKIFYCDTSQEIPRTFMTVQIDSDQLKPLPMINWLSQYFESEDEALSLCHEVSQKLQGLYEAGELNSLSLVAGNVGDEAVVFIGEETETDCQRVLFTLDTDEEPKKAFNQLLTADFKPARVRGDFVTRLDFSLFNLL